jgi:hypothetical protein
MHALERYAFRIRLAFDGPKSSKCSSALGNNRPAVSTYQPLRQLLEDMHDIPAMVVYRRMHVLTWNLGAAALLTDFGALPPRERNLVRLMFLDDAFRTLYADWPPAARDCVAILRMEAGLYPDDPDLIAPLTLDVHQLSIDPDLLIAAYTAARDSPSREALRVLLQSSDGPTADHATRDSDHH